MRWLRRLVVVVLFVAALAIGWRFAERNADPVFVDYLIGTFDGPRWAVLSGTFGLGVALGLVVMGFQTVRIALTKRRYRKLARELESEVHQLRNLPLAAPDVGRAPASDAALESRTRSG